MLSREQVIERLQWLRDAKPGDSYPSWAGANWGPAISEVAAEALKLIEQPAYQMLPPPKV